MAMCRMTHLRSKNEQTGAIPFDRRRPMAVYCR